jgi:hypothetical protein
MSVPDMSINAFVTHTRSVEKDSVAPPARGTPVLRQPDQLLLDCIDGVLTDVLGGKVREAIYDYLARQFSLAKEEIPAHLDKFSELLVKTFGNGAAILERRIASRLYGTMGREFVDVPNFKLNQHVALIKSMIDWGKKIDSKADRPK